MSFGTVTSRLQTRTSQIESDSCHTGIFISLRGVGVEIPYPCAVRQQVALSSQGLSFQLVRRRVMPVVNNVACHGAARPLQLPLLVTSCGLRGMGKQGSSKTCSKPALQFNNSDDVCTRSIYPVDTNAHAVLNTARDCLSCVAS